MTSANAARQDRQVEWLRAAVSLQRAEQHPTRQDEQVELLLEAVRRQRARYIRDPVGGLAPYLKG